MPDYKLHGLDPRTFQQLVQALALKEIGPGAVVYGDGADGARDATFLGQMSYPNDSAAWNGYLLIQAKFKQKPTGDTKKDGQWVRDQLQADLEKFIHPRPEQKLPEYYILATNIDLTAKPETGSDARVRQVFDDYAPKLGFKGYDIWDGLKIQRFLDAYRDIAIAYGGYITSGDVLAKMLAQLMGTQPDLEQAFSDYLQGELVKDQYARLREAGSASERRTSLARVFVDLPVSGEPDADPPEDEDQPDSDELPAGFVKQVIETGNLRLDRSSILERRTQETQARAQPHAEDGRFVLIGGPGQGKSTLGQYLCQLYRAALLKERPRSKLSEDATSALDITLSQCSHDKIELPSARRFPVRVDLKHFADELAKQRCVSLLDYIAQRIDARTTKPVRRSDLHTWLTAYPWLLILDGLDEVPASGNRTDVLDHIRQFSAQCATQGSDTLTVATSRPQGYGDAFDPKIYYHQHLLPLSTRRALHYASRLVEVCHQSDPILRKDILAKLERAASRTTTERLMRSPLQVTILAVLAELGGELPDDRWELFNKYYLTIYNRETQRGIVPLSTVLREHRHAIDRIHRIVGLRLQAASEIAGRSDSVLSKQEFKEITNSQLQEDSDDDQSRLAVASQITDAALDRLVFLVSPRGDDIGFEIRSLQEFMAADALMTGRDKEIHQRLETIAPFPYWRNVFLFCAGKCATDRDYMLSEIVGLCQTLSDESNPAAASTKAGSRLALDLLEDNTFHNHPKERRAIAEIALKLLELPTESSHIRLANVYRPNRGLDTVYTNALKRALLAAPSEQKPGAWITLSALASAGHQWAIDLANEFWPSDITSQVKTINQMQHQAHNAWIENKIIELTPRTQLSSVFPIMRIEGPKWFSAARHLIFDNIEHKTAPLHIDPSIPPLHLEYIALSSQLTSGWENLTEMPEPSHDWLLAIASARTLLNPTKETFARELQNLANKGWLPQSPNTWHWHTNWVLAACVSGTQTAADLHQASELMNSGKLLDRAQWAEQEEIWTQDGLPLDLTKAKLVIPDLLSRRFLRSVSLRSPWRKASVDIKKSAHSLATAYSHLKDPVSRTLSSRTILDCLKVMSGYFGGNPLETLDIPISPEIFEMWISESEVRWLPSRILRSINTGTKLSPQWAETLNKIGLSNISLHPSHSYPHFRTTSEIVDFYNEHPHMTGLLGWISCIVQEQENLDFSISKEILASNLGSNPKAQLRKAIIQIALGELTITEARAVAAHVATLISMKSSQDSFHLSEILNRHREEKWAIVFASELSQRLPLTTPETISSISFLEDRLREQKSPLHQPRCISSLGLHGVLPIGESSR